MKNLVLNGKRLWMAYLEAIMNTEKNDKTNKGLFIDNEFISSEERAKREYYLMRHRRFF